MPLSKEQIDFYKGQFQKKGKDCFVSGQYEQAARFYTKGLNIDPTDHMWLSNRSAAHLKLSNYVDAEKDARMCIDLCKNYSKGYGRLGYALMHQERYNDSKKAFLAGMEKEKNEGENYCSNGLKALREFLCEIESRNKTEKEMDKKESIDAKSCPKAAPLPIFSDEGSEICSLCGLCGHRADNCDQSKLKAPSSSSYEYCNHCNQLGHSSLYCPMKDKRDAYLRKSRDKVHRASSRQSCSICNSLDHQRERCPNRHLYRT
ncbi:Tetratricopeptide repeat protein [Perkinsela sp. CCAP 1560/4]|nr:Tetratricopeptide repeat protein [Perkinsela sp. CCAP 1560/4]|eukprot:KNH08136.1 Tetratricopeptide repeat protein [Perkinsela sp. CCAP 1560/4]